MQAEVPLASMIGYADDIRSLTQGEATLSIQFERYRPMPENGAGLLRRVIGDDNSNGAVGEAHATRPKTAGG